MTREVMQQALEALYENTQYSMRGDPIAYQDQRNDDIIEAIKEALAQPDLSDSEQHRLQMAAISTAAFGYWKKGDALNLDYWTGTLGDVADLYQKYDELYQKHVAQPVQPATDMSYTIALQRAIEWHCDGKAVPPSVAELCPYHAEKLNQALAQPEHPEQMARLGWQYVECPACGSEGARAFPKPEKQQSCDKQEPVGYASKNGVSMLLQNYGSTLYARADFDDAIPLYTSPPQRQPLTIVQIKTAVRSAGLMYTKPDEDVARAIEAAHGIGNKT